MPKHNVAFDCIYVTSTGGSGGLTVRFRCLLEALVRVTDKNWHTPGELLVEDVRIVEVVQMSHEYGKGHVVPYEIRDSRESLSQRDVVQWLNRQLNAEVDWLNSMRERAYEVYQRDNRPIVQELDWRGYVVGAK
jgi:hypothetical protein